MSRKEYNRSTTRREILTYENAGGTVSFGTFPTGTQIGVNVTVNELFNGTTNTVNVGTNSTGNKLISTYNVKTAGGKNSDTRFVVTDTENEIIAELTQTGDDTTAGAVTVTLDVVYPTYEEI